MNFEQQLPKACALAYLPRPAEVTLRLSLRAETADQACQQLSGPYAQLRMLVSDCLYATDERELIEVIAEHLTQRNLRLGVAESCTGGAVARRCMTSSGASRYFVGGVIAYQNKVKEQLLGGRSSAYRDLRIG